MAEFNIYFVKILSEYSLNFGKNIQIERNGKVTVTNFGWCVLGGVFLLAGALLWRTIVAWETQRVAWAAAFQDRQVDQNEEERVNWIGANCELKAQCDLLEQSVADLTHENDRLRDFMARVKVSDLGVTK